MSLGCLQLPLGCVLRLRCLYVCLRWCGVLGYGCLLINSVVVGSFVFICVSFGCFINVY